MYRYRGYFPGVEWPRIEINHSLPSTAKYKNAWSYICIPPICLHGVDTKHFNFLLCIIYLFIYLREYLQHISAYNRPSLGQHIVP